MLRTVRIRESASLCTDDGHVSVATHHQLGLDKKYRDCVNLPVIPYKQSCVLRTVMQSASPQPSSKPTSNASPVAMNASTTSDTMGTIVEPSLVNKGFFRAAVILGTVAAAIMGGQFLPGVPAMSLHLAAAGTWLGVNVWTTFFAGITMFKNLPRQVFGKLQAKLFPLCALATASVQHQPTSDAVLPRLPSCGHQFPGDSLL